MTTPIHAQRIAHADLLEEPTRHAIRIDLTKGFYLIADTPTQLFQAATRLQAIGEAWALMRGPSAADRVMPPGPRPDLTDAAYRIITNRSPFGGDAA